jgi:hypothetical protein
MIALPRLSTNKMALAGALVLPLLLCAGAASAQGLASDAGSALPFSPVVNGRHVQPRRHDMCRLLHDPTDCQKADRNAPGDDLFRDILGRSAP